MYIFGAYIAAVGHSAKPNRKVIHWELMDWIDLAKSWANRKTFLNTVAKVWVPQNVAKFWIS
jgi:hypothetical protein